MHAPANHNVLRWRRIDALASIRTLADLREWTLLVHLVVPIVLAGHFASGNAWAQPGETAQIRSATSTDRATGAAFDKPDRCGEPVREYSPPPASSVMTGSLHCELCAGRSSMVADDAGSHADVIESHLDLRRSGALPPFASLASLVLAAVSVDAPNSDRDSLLVQAGLVNLQLAPESYHRLFGTSDVRLKLAFEPARENTQVPPSARSLIVIRRKSWTFELGNDQNQDLTTLTGR